MIAVQRKLLCENQESVLRFFDLFHPLKDYPYGIKQTLEDVSVLSRQKIFRKNLVSKIQNVENPVTDSELKLLWNLFLDFLKSEGNSIKICQVKEI